MSYLQVSFDRNIRESLYAWNKAEQDQKIFQVDRMITSRVTEEKISETLKLIWLLVHALGFHLGRSKFSRSNKLSKNVE